MGTSYMGVFPLSFFSTLVVNHLLLSHYIVLVSFPSSITFWSVCWLLKLMFYVGFKMMFMTLSAVIRYRNLEESEAFLSSHAYVSPSRVFMYRRGEMRVHTPLLHVWGFTALWFWFLIFVLWQQGRWWWYLCFPSICWLVIIKVFFLIM